MTASVEEPALDEESVRRLGWMVRPMPRAWTASLPLIWRMMPWAPLGGAARAGAAR